MKTVNPIHRSDRLHQDAGTFYRTFYDDAERVYTLFDSMSWSCQLLLDDALDAAKLFVRSVMPPLHRERFLPLRVEETVYREGKQKLLVYGQENVRYGEAYYYGHPAATVTGAVELPAGVTDVDLCCDLPIDPGIVLIKNEHFTIRNGFLFFQDDLFDRMPVVEEPGRDRSVVLYLRGVSIDRRDVQDRLGVLTRSEGPSNATYAAFANLVMDCIQEGTSYHRLSQLLGRLYDVPCTQEIETVESLGVTDNGRWLATDRTFHTAPLMANFLYSPGTTLQAGTFLTDAVRPIRGRSLPEGVPIVFERRFLGDAYRAGLIFPNEEMPLVMDTAHPYPTFPIIGRDEDVELFWESFYSRTDDRGLLPRVAPGGILNPARFIYDHVLYPRAQIYLVFLDKTGPNRLPNVNTHLLRGLLPPGILFSLLVVAPTRTLTLDPLHLSCSPTQTFRTGPTTRLGITLQADRFASRRC